MKHMMLVSIFVMAAITGVNAQQTKKGVTVEYAQFVLSSFPQTNASAASAPLFLGGRMEKGKKEQFGATLGAAQAPVIELLDAGNKVIRSMSANDLIGKSSAGGKLLRTTYDDLGTRSEAVYEVALAQGKCELAISSLAAAGTQGAKPKIITTIHLQGASADVAAIRLTLAVEGQSSVQENGFVIAAKALPAALSAAVFPKPRSVAVEKNILTIVSSVPAGSRSASGQPLLWIVAEGAGASAPAAAALKANAQYAADPNLVIVTTADKSRTQPADTVTYSLICTNIGLGNATDVVLSNPIPAGTSFLEGSAEGRGTVITIDREQAAAPQLGAAKSVSWKLNEPLTPGAEKVVSFKIIVR